MKKKKILYIFSLVLLLFGIVTYRCRGHTQENILTEIASEYFKLIKNKNVNGASKLFHYPTDHTEQEIIKDMNVIGRSLQIFINEFGAVLRADLVETRDIFYHVSIGGGDLSYWKKHPNSINLTYKVKFKKAGQGYIDIMFCNINNKWDIRQVSYGLPQSRPDSKEYILDITQKIFQLIH
ncbi:MAG: hypothetical protein ACMUJM_00700 [bacterium]